MMSPFTSSDDAKQVPPEDSSMFPLTYHPMVALAKNEVLAFSVMIDCTVALSGVIAILFVAVFCETAGEVDRCLDS